MNLKLKSEMPYYRRRTYRRRPYTRRRINYRYARALVNRVAEKKDVLTEFSADAVSNAGTLYTLNDIQAAGTTHGRIGTTCSMLGVYLRLLFKPSATDENDHMRVVVGRAKGNVLTSADMVTDLSNPPDTTKYHVLLDYIMSGHVGGGATDVGIASEYKSWYWKLRSPVKFYDTASTTMVAGQVFMWVISDSGAVPHPTIDGYSRVIYTDV